MRLHSRWRRPAKRRNSGSQAAWKLLMILNAMMRTNRLGNRFFNQCRLDF